MNRLCEDADLQAVNKRVLESLVKAGAFDSLYGAGGPVGDGAVRRLRLRCSCWRWSDGAIERREPAAEEPGPRPARAVRRVGGRRSRKDPRRALPDVPAWTEKEQLAFEKEALGLYLSGHPMDRFRKELDGAGVRSIDTLTESAASVTVGGIISERRSLKTRKGDPMAVVTVEDRGGRLEAVVFPEAFRKYGRLLDAAADACPSWWSAASWR